MVERVLDFSATLLRSREYAFPPRFWHLDQPVLRVAVDAERKLFGFFYRDGVRFAVKQWSRSVGRLPEDLTLEDACTYYGQ